MTDKKHNVSEGFSDSPQVRDILLSHGLFQTIHGDYIAASVVGRIIPNRKNGTAVCKDKYGNRTAILRWPQSTGDRHGE